MIALAAATALEAGRACDAEKPTCDQVRPASADR